MSGGGAETLGYGEVGAVDEKARAVSSVCSGPLGAWGFEDGGTPPGFNQ
eukprot:CAMPEP_0172163554 /NCGR_PEP_ID=MMETSP1050-20130122/7336_1 /TAXON_ID=233186 /ORGANISM="Cryptomonas curvata, Strain CCAP979/52" /LENGTH=48 /DNA_ID= /DNA_START= /DNA_END= /DNA_ORIENTATION=